MDATDGAPSPGAPDPAHDLSVPARAEIGPDEFQAAFGERLADLLDPESWRSGQDLALVYDRMAQQVERAVRNEERIRQPIREQLFPRIATQAAAPKEAGLHRADLRAIERIHRDLLFQGGVECADGTVQKHDTLPITFYQVGVSLVSYRGDEGTWVQRLFRRDLRLDVGDPFDEALALLERRAARGGLNQTSERDELNELAQRAIMAYAERAVLLRKATAVWRLGHGNPAPFELLTGSGSVDMMIESTRMLEELILQHRKFLFVASEPGRRELLTIGQALQPLEYAIVERFSEHIAPTVARRHYQYHHRYEADTTIDGRRLTPAEWIGRFRDEVASRVVVGIYRASELAPPRVFYAHEDHTHLAAHIALADSVLQEHRGFPLLIDLADRICAATFGPDSLV
ncbi:MAG: hypothetical protein IT307_00005, partial [Chloroflexi bacterium]|nr:hypothetical protein [Chloroflexota bacterium]